MMKRVAIFMPIFILALTFSSSAQPASSQLVFAYLGLELEAGTSLTDTDVDLINTRLKSYLQEIARQENYSLTAPRDSSQIRAALVRSSGDYREYLASNRRITSQGLILLTLAKQKSYTLSATIIDPENGEMLFNVKNTYPEFSSLLENSKTLMFELFGLSAPVQGAVVQVTPYSTFTGKASKITLQDIAGTWQGDFDLKEVVIQEDGFGVARLSNDETMKLRVSIENQYVVISQDEPNSPRFYLGSFPLNLATQIARLARPMTWQFTMSPRKDQLEGIKNTSNFTYQRGQIIQTDNTYSRDAVWTRIP